MFARDERSSLFVWSRKKTKEASFSFIILIPVAWSIKRFTAVIVTVS